MYDIVIIGGGIAGLYTALNLNKSNNLHSDISNKIREVYPIKYI